MTDGCSAFRDDLPLHAAGALDGERMRDVERHLQACAECRAESELIALLRTPLAAPTGLAARIGGAVAAAPAIGAPRYLRLAVAAGIAALALTATVLVSQRAEQEVDGGTAGELVELGWAARMDPVLHGGPGIDALSDEELELLLEEMQS